MAKQRLPRVTSEHLSRDYWLRRSRRYGDLDAPVLSAAALRDHDQALKQLPHTALGSVVDLRAPVDVASVVATVSERLAAVRQRMHSGAYRDAHGKRLGAATIAAVAALSAIPAAETSWRTAQQRLQLRCAPLPQSFYGVDGDRRFDRNNCSQVRAGETVQQLGRWPNGMRLLRSVAALGWVGGDAALSAPLSEAERDQRLNLRQQPLTRRAFLNAAFDRMGTPYGWGGQDGGLDCSNLVMDLFASFGLQLPRTSEAQSRAGSFSIDMRSVNADQQRRWWLETAQQRGIVLLHFPGHIGVYLGTNDSGTPMMLHALADYAQACPQRLASNAQFAKQAPVGPTATAPTSPLSTDAPEFTTVHVDRVTVSDLELGRDTPRQSLLQRLQRITVFGADPGDTLAGAVERRAAAAPTAMVAAECPANVPWRAFVSPLQPRLGEPVRVIWTSSLDRAPLALRVSDPKGRQVDAVLRTLGGPPYAYWTTLQPTIAGTWTLRLGDGQRLEGCVAVQVRAAASMAGPPVTGAAVASRRAVTVVASQPTDAAGDKVTGKPMAWEATGPWNDDDENLYAAFVEQLFRAPEDDEDFTWRDLHTLLRDPQRNLLYDHFGLSEEQALQLQPDCADLPYFLRAYFAWKRRLPFGFRACSRGRAYSPPTCGPLQTQADAVEGADALQRFRALLRRVANAVHSSSARTAPEAEASDLYPVPLNRRALRPGTVFADPNGHLLVLTRWVPQGVASYGALLAADAQPDGTIARPRFWPGSFLFTPQTTSAGAGFKAWRPLVPESKSGAWVALDNDTLRRSIQRPEHSLQQYSGDAASFYDRVEAIINPRPLEASAWMKARVAALHEVLRRRLVSVDNGEDYVRLHPGVVIPMPEGHAVFETQGPWEDFATPARDMRVLIAIDTVRGLADEVRRQPQRFGLGDKAQLTATVEELPPALRRELEGRSIAYRRSDGVMQTLTLQNLVDRQAALELAYNPNDCIELRWGAAPGSSEHDSCKRRAPAEQQARMQRYREWFHRRQRPPR